MHMPICMDGGSSAWTRLQTHVRLYFYLLYHMHRLLYKCPRQTLLYSCDLCFTCTTVKVHRALMRDRQHLSREAGSTKRTAETHVCRDRGMLAQRYPAAGGQLLKHCLDLDSTPAGSK